MLIKAQKRSVSRSFRSLPVVPASRAVKCDASSAVGRRVRTAR